MNKPQKEHPLLHLKFEGLAIRNDTILFDDLSTFVSNFRLAVEHLINKSQTGASIKKGRPLKAMQVLSALEIVSMGEGCFELSLDLRRNGQQFPGWDIGEQAIYELLSGLKAIDEDKELPVNYDQSVLIPLREAGKVIDRGIERIYINSRGTFGETSVTYEQPIREKIITRISKYEHSYAIVEGRLLMLDVEEDKLRCRLRPSTGEPIQCSYDEDLANQLMRFLRQFVQARGEAKYDPNTGNLIHMHIRDLEAVEEISDDISLMPSLSSFWQGKSFEELATEQVVYPIGNLSEMYSEWPENTDFDSFFESIKSARD